MSDHTAVVEHGHAPGEHAHPGPGTYLLIGVILFFLTVIEVVIVYIPAIASQPLLMIPMLMVLMTIKFALVVMFFMHLKFDNRLFSFLFTAPLLIAVCITLALMALFGAYAVGQYGAPGETPAKEGGSGH
jgi:cytochrome c oxidase subunit IV